MECVLKPWKPTTYTGTKRLLSGVKQSLNDKGEKIMNKLKCKIIAVIYLINAIFFMYAGIVNAALEPRLAGEIIYDTDRDYSVLANANLASSETFGVSGIHPDGSMDWNTAVLWIKAMNDANYLGFSDWRLPSAINPELRPNITSCRTVITYCLNGDLVHLFLNELSGATVVGGVSGITDPDISLFWNFPQNNTIVYWTGTDASRGRFRRHRVLVINNSRIYAHRVSNTYLGYVLPVRDGDSGLSGTNTSNTNSNNSAGNSNGGAATSVNTVVVAPVVSPNALEYEAIGRITAVNPLSLEINYTTTVWYSDTTHIRLGKLGGFGLGLKVKIVGMENPDGQVLASKIVVK